MGPSPLRHLYSRLSSFASLYAAARRAQLGKRYRPAVLAFNANLETELLRLQEELRAFTYRPGPYRQFSIRDPKPRLISAAPYRDRVVHHALCAAIVPPLERGFHRGSHANRRGYGSHRALRRFTAAAARHRWVLQADIRLYFPSIDLTILRHQLAALIACPGTLWLLDQILANGASHGPALDAFPGDTLLTPLERPRGLPIGNLTSQFLANVHLNGLDHTLGALPGVRAYLRYVDDLALFADHPEPLSRACSEMEQELAASGSFHLLDGEASSDQRPVERVSWEEAMEFCRRLSQRTGRAYMLPSEAQWEYACRAGKSTPFAFGETITPELANYNGTYTYANGQKGAYRQQTTPVGMFPANAWGLQDMHGNVLEWCLDDWHESYGGAPSDGSAWVDGAEGGSKGEEQRKLLRGGSWFVVPGRCRSASRIHVGPGFAFYDFGFRVVCLPQGPSLNA